MAPSIGRSCAGYLYSDNKSASDEDIAVVFDSPREQDSDDISYVQLLWIIPEYTSRTQGRDIT